MNINFTSTHISASSLLTFLLLSTFLPLTFSSSPSHFSSFNFSSSPHIFSSSFFSLLDASSLSWTPLLLPHFFSFFQLFFLFPHIFLFIFFWLVCFFFLLHHLFLLSHDKCYSSLGILQVTVTFDKKQNLKTIQIFPVLSQKLNLYSEDLEWCFITGLGKDQIFNLT